MPGTVGGKRRSKRGSRYGSKRHSYRRSRRQSKSSERATSNMSLTQLQRMAKSRGIPFGGLRRTQLVRRINSYS